MLEIFENFSDFPFQFLSHFLDKLIPVILVTSFLFLPASSFSIVTHGGFLGCQGCFAFGYASLRPSGFGTPAPPPPLTARRRAKKAHPRNWITPEALFLIPKNKDYLPYRFSYSDLQKLKFYKVLAYYMLFA